MRLFAILVFAALSGAPGLALAQSRETNCSFDRLVEQDGTTKTVDYTMSYLSDDGTSDGFVIVNGNELEIRVQNGTRARSFVYVLDSGFVQTTTVHLSDSQAVHSRTSRIDGVLRSAMYFGTCNTD